MIFVDRSSVIDPFDDPFLKRKAAEEVEHARMAVSGMQMQRRFEFAVFKHPQIKATLSTLFHDKCAYCEAPLVGASGDIEQFRPKAGVSEAPDHHGYWWLAASWQNLLIACQFCNRMQKADLGTGERSELVGKQNRFPLIDETTRAYSSDADLSLEQPLLLDPTVDDPAPHLTFSDEGLVFSETDRGNVTISTLGLNRLTLVKQRRSTADRYRSLLSMVIGSIENDDRQSEHLISELAEMAADSAQYAGMIRQFLARDWPKIEREALGLPDKAEVARFAHILQSATRSSAATPARVKRAARETRAYRERMTDYSLADQEGLKRYKSQRRTIETISISNIRAIGKLDVSLAGSGDTAGRWLMLLGENGTGKSSVLQAIALVLAGSEYVSRLIKEGRITLANLVRFGSRQGEIVVKLSGFDAPHRLKLFRDRLEFTGPRKDTVTITADGVITGDGWGPQTLLAGYGATRLPPRKNAEIPQGNAFAKVDNLFDPFVPLIHPEEWLRSLKALAFNRAAIILKDLMAIDIDARLIRTGGRVKVKDAKGSISLDSLSVGYQTVVAVTADILEILSRVWSNPLEAEGIVLIDELDSHLHPTWQMQIVNGLRKALPGVQFIATTHQPLCLRGLAEGEVIVMRRGESHGIDVITDLPSPADFRVDQLLTSPFFGLNSTVDPDTERLFDRYYALLAMQDRGAQDEEELAKLTGALDGRKQFGNTEREGLYLKAIDRVLAKRKTMPALSQEEISEKAVTEISAIWDELTRDIVPPDGEPA